MDKPATDPDWQKLRKNFKKKVDDKEKGAPAGHWMRLHASPAPDGRPNDPRVAFHLDRGCEEDSPLEFIELAQEAGTASLGSTCTLVALMATGAAAVAGVVRRKMMR